MSEALTKIGSLIKNKRVDLGMSVKDLADKSRVGYSNIVNIEEGIRSELPEDACLSGFIKILLKTLKFEDSEKILADYNSIRESQEFISLTNSGRHLNKPLEQNNVQNKLDSKKLLYLLLAFIFFITISNSFLQNASRIRQEKADHTLIQQKALTEQAKKNSKKALVKDKPEVENGLKKINIKVTDNAWLQIISAETGKVIFEGDVKPSSEDLKFSDKEGFVVASGNAGALEVIADTSEPKYLGKKDESIKWYYPDSAKEAYKKNHELKKDTDD